MAQYTFEDIITEQFINKLGKLGTLEYFKDFPRPFYRIVCRSGIQIKGVEGEAYFKAIFPANSEKGKEELAKQISG
jgi:hypothetical protein